ncbi:tripartite tricarboxylate transporter substrate binding protein [Cupriavidus sp. L7L]|uniref:Bug family tripartite tricarboxylate transporter substrate binding protein n=1 Tax=Cupriavidus sp. L7L TaxID=2546443 RepID=UPI0014043AE3|nr:tripartite tricarboxylate transporter substrate binding protein [Cupriavidus sp. L7L]
MRKLRRHLVSLLGILIAATSATAEEWKPTNRVEYIIPAGAGGAVDNYGRIMKQALDSRGVWGDQVLIISNKPGGQGMIAAAPLLQRPGDATVFTMLSTGQMLAQVQGEFKHDLLNDFTIGPIFFEEAIGVAVRADSPIQTAADLVAQLRRAPSSLKIAVAPGLNNHIHIGILKPLKAASVDTSKLTVAPFRSSAESVAALLGGHVDVASASAANLLSGVRNKTLRVIAVSSSTRLKGTLAHVPTWKEQGVNSVFTSIQGVLFPKNLSPEQIRFWDKTFRMLSTSREWAGALEQYEVTPRFMDHAQARAYVAEQLKASAVLVRELELTK